MKYQRILEAIYKTPLAISSAGFETIDAILRARLVDASRPDKDFFGNPMDKMEIENGTAIIPINGPLLQHADLLDKQCGATSYEDIREDVQTASDRADVERIILNFNSPGGQAFGCLELAEFIADIQEQGTPCYAFTDTQCCSAAYMLASSCDQIFACRTAMVGSIGCIIAFLDMTKAMEMEGKKAEVFTSGKYKATAMPGTSVTPEQAEYLQELVNSSFALFEQHVLAHRPDIDPDALQGQLFFGLEAKAMGVIDETIDSIEDLVETVG